MRRNTVNCHSPRFLAGIALALMTSASAGGGVVWLDELEIVNIEAGWRQVERNRSVSQQPLRIGGEMFERGAGVHAVSLAEIALDGRAQRFSASVGVDDVMSGKGSVEFLVVGDGMVLWRSGVMHGGDAARPVHVELSGVRKLQLKVEDGGDGIGQDHANWAMARFEVDGAPPRILGFDDTPIPDLPISPTNRSAARAAVFPNPPPVAWPVG